MEITKVSTSALTLREVGVCGALEYVNEEAQSHHFNHMNIGAQSWFGRLLDVWYPG